MIRSWTADDGASRYLWQASDDGSPPAFSVFARSEQELLEQVNT